MQIENDSSEQPSVLFHCVTYVKSDDRLLNREVRDMMKNELHFLADLLELEVLAYVILPDHCHLLLRDRDSHNMDSNELATKWRVYARRRWEAQGEARSLEVSEESQPDMPQEFRKRMGNISVYLKELKQRVSLFHNKLNRTCGALWKNRFRTILVDPDPRVVQRVAAYIHLNPVRHLLCNDPADYAWSSYTDALSGDLRARPGLFRVTGQIEWETALEQYARILYGREEPCELPDPDVLANRLKKGGDLEPNEVMLLRRKRYILTEMMGTPEFVDACVKAYPNLKDSSVLVMDFTEGRGSPLETYFPDGIANTARKEIR